MTAEAMRVLLIITIISLALLSIFYLRQRRLSWLAFCFWGLVALLLPVLGPFLVIACRPGQARWINFPRGLARSGPARHQVRSFPWRQS